MADNDRVSRAVEALNGPAESTADSVEETVEKTEESGDEGVESGEEIEEGASTEEEEEGDEAAAAATEGGEEEEEEEEESEEGEEEESEDGEGEELEEAVDDSELDFADHPRFVELKATEETFQKLESVLAAGAYGIVLEGDVDKGIGELKAQLEDSAALYGIIDGKLHVSQLLNTAAKNFGVDTAKRIYLEVKEWAKANAEHLGDAYSEGDDGGDEGEFDDPLQKQIASLTKLVGTLQQQIRTRGTAAAGTEGEEATHRERTEVFNKFQGHIQALAKKRNLDAEDTKEFVDAIAKRVGGNKAILARIKNGKFVDVDRFFTEQYNRLAKKIVKMSNRRVDNKKIRDKKVPKNPASSASASSAATNEARPKTRAERIAAAKDFL